MSLKTTKFEIFKVAPKQWLILCMSVKGGGGNFILIQIFTDFIEIWIEGQKIPKENDKKMIFEVALKRRHVCRRGGGSFILIPNN